MSVSSVFNGFIGGSVVVVLIKFVLLVGMLIVNIVDFIVFVCVLFVVVEDVAFNRRSRRGKFSRGVDLKYFFMFFKNVVGGVLSLMIVFFIVVYVLYVL